MLRRRLALVCLAGTVMACGGSASPPPHPGAPSDTGGSGGSAGGPIGVPAGGSPGQTTPADAAVGARPDAAVGSGEGADAAIVTPTPPAEGDLATWPQAGGPDGTFRINVEGAPTTWSVAANKNILWT